MSSNTKIGSRAPNCTRSSFSLAQPLLEIDVIPVIFVGCGPIRLFAESEDNTLLTLKVLDELEDWRGVIEAVSEIQVTGAVIACLELAMRFAHCD